MLIKFLLKRFNCDTVNYLCCERSTDIHDLIKEKLLCFVLSKILTNDLEAIVTSGACEISSYIVLYVNIELNVFIHLSSEKCFCFPKLVMWL